MPLPDQDIIREDVARAKYRSKIDLADAYEQVQVKPKDVHKTVDDANYPVCAETHTNDRREVKDSQG
jgi:ArsR family metal-binding transcriptional regulator